MQRFKDIQARLSGFVQRRKDDYWASLATLSTALIMTPTPAFAANTTDANSMLQTIMGLAQTAVTLLGGCLVVWGGVKFGLAVKEHQGGNAMTESIATIGGGAIIIAAAVYFGQLASQNTFTS